MMKARLHCNLKDVQYVNSRCSDSVFLSRQRVYREIRFWFSLCNLCVLCVSVVRVLHEILTTETQITQGLHREFTTDR
jgi:hypothetical protein